MAIFKDGNGRQWQVLITGSEMIRMKRELGVDICKTTSADADGIPSLLADLERLIGCLWVCLEEQMDEAGIDENGFAKMLAGDTLNIATEAWMEAVSDFFPVSQQRRLVKAVIRKGLEMGPALQDAMADQIEAMDVKEMIRTQFTGSSLSGAEL